MTKTQLPCVFQDTSFKTLTPTPTPTPTENIAGQALASGLNKFKHFLALSLLITLSFNALAVDDNSEQPNKEELNKEACLDLSKPYTHKQS